MERDTGVRVQKRLRYQDGTYCQKCGEKVDGAVKVIRVIGVGNVRYCAECARGYSKEVSVESR